MINLDENALICDLAETYQIYDYRSLPVSTVAALSAGLRENSRIMTIMRGGSLITPEIALALIYDLIARWAGVNEGVSLVAEIEGGSEKKATTQYKSFGSSDEFEQARRKAIGEN